jgi:putative membrane protein
MYYEHYGSNSMMDGFGWIFMFSMMVLLFIGLVMVLRHFKHATGSEQKPDAALEVLKYRYAKGEIDKKEFDQKRKDLTE